MKGFLLMIALTLIFIGAHSQTEQALVGTWYAKPYSHPRHQSKATLYTKKVFPNSKESLNIDPEFHYTYKQWNSGDTLINKGTISLQGDTMIFIQTQTTSKNVRPQDTIRLYLYFASDTQLIYSYYQLPKRAAKPPDPAETDDSDKKFTRVEVEAAYKSGANIFYKTIYQQLGKSTEPSAATGILEYRIIIDVSGNVEPGSLEARNEISKPYLSVIAEALKNLEGNFIPAFQNGRAVRSYYSFQVNY
jgi:hypothetical protein